MKVNEPGRQKLESQISWQQAKLYSDVPQAQQEIFCASGLSAEGLNFCARDTPTQVSIDEVHLTAFQNVVSQRHFLGSGQD